MSDPKVIYVPGQVRGLLLDRALRRPYRPLHGPAAGAGRAGGPAAPPCYMIQCNIL